MMALGLEGLMEFCRYPHEGFLNACWQNAFDSPDDLFVSDDSAPLVFNVNAPRGNDIIEFVR